MHSSIPPLGSILPPSDAYAAHLGNGVVQIRAEHPSPSQVDEFEVQSSYDINGPYYKVSNYIFNGLDGFLYGFVPGFTVYMQIRAVNTYTDGTQDISDWVQVKAAEISKPIVVAECTAIEGSRIEDGAIFTHTKAGRIFGLEAIGQIDF